MYEEIIENLFKNVKKEKQILERLIDDQKYSEEIKEELKEKYKEISKNTMRLIEELINSTSNIEELLKEIDKKANRQLNKEEDQIIKLNITQLVLDQITTHKYMNLPIKNKIEFQSSSRSIHGEYMVILYSLAKEYLNKIDKKNNRKLFLKLMINRFLSEYAIKYYLMGEETFAEKFCNPHLYFDNNRINYLLADNNIKLKSYLSLIKSSLSPIIEEPSLGFNQTINTMYNFSELYLTALLVQYRKHGYIPNINLETLDEFERNTISNCAKKANEFCNNHQITDDFQYRKTR